MQQQELPNLNYGLNVKTLSVAMKPSIVPAILDHYLRKPLDQDYIVGTLLGTIDGQKVNVSNSFGVPLTYHKDKDGEGEFHVDMEFQAKMLKFYSNVNPNEGLVGMYISSVVFDALTTAAVGHYHSLFNKEEKSKNALLPSPVILMIDPKLSKSHMPLKVYYTANTFLKDLPMFCELRHEFEMEEVDETGLDILYYG